MINAKLKFLKYKIPVVAYILLASSFIHAFCKSYMYFFLIIEWSVCTPVLVKF